VVNVTFVVLAAVGVGVGVGVNNVMVDVAFYDLTPKSLLIVVLFWIYCYYKFQNGSFSLCGKVCFLIDATVERKHQFWNL
jgi:hypothetical protein